MNLDPTVCDRARLARDPRFDGRFFIAVATTGVYCRPVCPVRPPRRRNIRFLPTAAACEARGFRPCRRCRPETAPGTPAWAGTSAVVQRALRLIDAEVGTSLRVEALALRLGVGARHLRRLFAEHVGASPAAVARTRRVHFARQLIDQTELPFAQIALAAGFGSVRQFNAAVGGCFGASPRELRGRSAPSGDRGLLCLRLPYRPPFAAAAALSFLASRTLPGVDEVRENRYRRAFVEGDGGVGIVEIADRPEARCLELRLSGASPPALLPLIRGVRRLFDLDADSRQIEADLGRDPLLAPLVAARPGLRLVGAFEPFEILVRAILGQRTTGGGATSPTGRLLRFFGKPVAIAGEKGLTYAFPTADLLAEADIATLGIPTSRARAVRSVARAVAKGNLDLTGCAPHEETVARLGSLPSMGDGAIRDAAMRALSHPDAFPIGDLRIRRALAGADGALPSDAAVRERAAGWSPWRAYAASWLRQRVTRRGAADGVEPHRRATSQPEAMRVHN